MPQAEATQYLQQVYSEPIKDHLIGIRVQEIKQSGAVCAVSFTPQNTKRLSPIAVEAGADMVVAQDRFDAGTGEGRADILRQSRGGDARAGQKSCDHQLAHNRYSIRHSIPHRGRDAEAGAQALVS